MLSKPRRRTNRHSRGFPTEELNTKLIRDTAEMAALHSHAVTETRPQLDLVNNNSPHPIQQSTGKYHKPPPNLLIPNPTPSAPTHSS